MLIDLTDRVALVTGASRGIGRAIAVGLASCGADVAINYNSSLQAAEETAALVRTHGRRLLLVQGDVGSPDDAKRIVRETTDVMGALDILVNNAGIIHDGAFARMSEQDWDEVISTNLKGPFLLSKAAFRPLRKSDQARIINISSVVGRMGHGFQVNYSASKGGLISLTRSLADELGESVLVNCVAPGFVDTDITSHLNDEQRQLIIDSTPLRRTARPEEIAPWVAFLASGLNTFATGAVIDVNGGLWMG